MSDEAIASAVQRGEVSAFGVLLERYESKLTRYGRRFLLHAEDIQDLVQEVFLKAYVNIQSFDARRRFSPWIYRIAHNEFVRALARRTRERVAFLDLDTLLPHPVAAQTADGDVQREELRRTLDRCLDQLDAKYREPVVLYYFEDMDYRTIAEILQVPVATVGVRLRRARARLKTLLRAAGEPYGARS